MISWGNAIELLSATAIASALGSLHCVGMCGPFAIMASGASSTTGRSDGSATFASIRQMAAYHVGRLVTYLVLGLLVGFLASSLGRWEWFQAVGMWAGGVLISLGVLRLWNAMASEGRTLGNATVQHSKLVQAWSFQLARFRRLLPKQARWQIAFGWGLTTTLLPCGWLYVFLITAAASATTMMAMATMFAFWLGTLPLLSLSVWGWRLIGERWRGASGVVSSLCIVTMGIYLMIARSTVDLPIPATLLNQAAASEGIATMPSDNLMQSDHLSSQQIASETGLERLNRLRIILNEGMPCCQDDKNDGGN